MNNWYAKLAAEQGEAFARAKMKQIRSLVKDHPGGSFRDPDFARAAQTKSVAARQKHAQDKQTEKGRQPS